FRPPALRSEAARAAGLLQDRGLESQAQRLIAGDATPPMVNRLCAALLIVRHDGDEALKLLTKFAVDTEPAVAVAALTRLIKAEPHRVLPLAGRAIENADPKVRLCGADAYVLQPDPQRV